MYNEHFEQETFKSDVAKAVIKPITMMPKSFQQPNDSFGFIRGYSMSMIHNIIHTSYNRMHGHGAVRYAMYAVTITKLELLRTTHWFKMVKIPLKVVSLVYLFFAGFRGNQRGQAPQWYVPSLRT
eukprot:scaffold4050_cov88-Skeletonema_dohrnii-CCMP3373.AAC.3